jgi:hypothetical protein
VINDGAANPIGLGEAERELVDGAILCEEFRVLGEITFGLDAHAEPVDLVAERELERARGLFGPLIHRAVPLPDETISIVPYRSLHEREVGYGPAGLGVDDRSLDGGRRCHHDLVPCAREHLDSGRSPWHRF